MLPAHVAACGTQRRRACEVTFAGRLDAADVHVPKTAVGGSIRARRPNVPAWVAHKPWLVSEDVHAAPHTPMRSSYVVGMDPVEQSVPFVTPAAQAQALAVAVGFSKASAVSKPSGHPSARVFANSRRFQPVTFAGIGHARFVQSAPPVTGLAPYAEPVVGSVPPASPSEKEELLVPSAENPHATCNKTTTNTDIAARGANGTKRIR